MTQFLADENFNNQIVRGVLRQNPDIDIVRVQDIGLSGADDPAVLAWAAQERRIVLTHYAVHINFVLRYFKNPKYREPANNKKGHTMRPQNREIRSNHNNSKAA